MKQMLIKILRTIFSDARQAIIAIIVLLIVGGTGGLLYLSKTALSFSIQILSTTTPLWATILFVLMCCLYAYFKIRQYQNSQNPNIQEELYEEFGINWNKQYKKRCLRCKSPLKNASVQYGPSVFWCSRCNCKYVLKDSSGNLLTEQEAIKKIKMLTSG